MQTRRLNGFDNTVNRLIGHLGTMLLAVILALIIWLIAVTQENPIIQEKYPTPIPLEVIGLADDLQLLENLNDKSVVVVVRAVQDVHNSLQVEDFRAYVDLTEFDIGTHSVEIKVAVDVPEVTITAISEPSLQLQLDRVISKTVPVRVEVLDGAAYGYSWREPITEPSEVTISGPATRVEQVVDVAASINLYNASTQIERLQVVSPRDREDKPVEHVQAVPSTVQIIVSITPWPGRKEIAICFNQEGQPDPDYRLSAVEFTPPAIVLLGDSALLNQIPCVETEPLTLEGATSDVEQRLSLILPEGVTSLEWNSVSVVADIAPIEGGLTVKRHPILREVGEGLTARPALETVDVILSGPQPRLKTLTEEDVRVVLNLSGLLPGNHTIRPAVEVPDGIRQDGVLPETVEVIITGPSTPEPGGVSGPINAETSARDEAVAGSTNDGTIPPTPTP